VNEADGAGGTVEVGLGARGYAVRVEAGALRAIGVLVADLAPSACAVIGAAGPALQYAEDVHDAVRAAGLDAHLLQAERGERHKTLANVERLCEGMARIGLDRRSLIVAVGGGMLTDMAGLAAALFMRGIGVIQAPTTLLAQVDASIGGKTGVNLRSGKNLVGAFHQPRAVVADPLTLMTLPVREMRCGLAEVLKHGFIRDGAYLGAVRADMARLRAREPGALCRVVLGSCRIKAAVVASDETEQGVRGVLNFGHTVGHALEALTGYRCLRHGEAVAIGMLSACLIGEEVGVTPSNVTATVASALAEAGLPRALPASVSVDAVVAAMAGDKKSERGSPRFVLLRDVGAGEPGYAVPQDRLRAALHRARTA
jgi:3-dehydroquinate synthase